MTQTNTNNLLSLEQQIAAARQRLQELYAVRGCTDAVVLAASIAMDQLLNEQYRQLRRKNRQIKTKLLPAKSR